MTLCLKKILKKMFIALMVLALGILLTQVDLAAGEKTKKEAGPIDWDFDRYC